MYSMHLWNAKAAFAEGTLTVEATVADIAGNTATSSDTIVKDTLADISVDFDGFGDEYYNSAEVRWRIGRHGDQC